MTETNEAPAVPQGEARLLIGGKLVESKSGQFFDNINPATEKVIGQTSDATPEDARDAIAAARSAFDTSAWATDRELRKRCLLQLQAALESEREELRAELVAEVGTPIQLTYGYQLDAVLDEALKWPIEFMDTFQWERELPHGHNFGSNSRRFVWKEPVGVVGAIVPWNAPLEVTLNKLGQALATGNTVVLKPAPDTPWNATRIGRLVAEQTDFPPGVLNVVASSDNMVGEELVIDPRVDAISFTGSTAVGKGIMQKGAANVKRVFLELGGKSANIYLDDADLEMYLPFTTFACLHGGQGCSLPTRVLLPRSRYDEGVELIKNAWEAVPYGDPLDPKNISGPQISEKQRSRVLSYIEKGVAEGATLVTGGGRPEHLPQGYYVQPTVFADVTNEMTIGREEIFGPVVVVIPFEDDDDAVRIANDSEYGLGGAVTAATDERALAVGRRLRTGTVQINGGNWYGADSPFGGYKSSGLGRQNGLEGFEQYTETKAVAVEIRP